GFTISVKSAACLDTTSGQAILIGTAYHGTGCAIPTTSNPDTGVSSNPPGGGGSPPPTTSTTDTTTTTPDSGTAPIPTTVPASTTPSTTTTTTTAAPALGNSVLTTKLSVTPIPANSSVYDTAKLANVTS